MARDIKSLAVESKQRSSFMRTSNGVQGAAWPTEPIMTDDHPDLVTPNMTTTFAPVTNKGGMNRVESFPPIVSEKSKVLVLGSMPGEGSLKARQYYAHPRNAFWRIMGELFGAKPALPYEERVLRLQSVGVALWDSLQVCVRPGSLDASITDGAVNDFPAFFAKHSGITHVFFNGGKSQVVFRRHALPLLPNAPQVFTRLPSTSPAHAGMPFEAKLQTWSAVKKVLF
jgi:hypoxanthine-DNA glycosylase